MPRRQSNEGMLLKPWICRERGRLRPIDLAAILNSEGHDQSDRVSKGDGVLTAVPYILNDESSMQRDRRAGMLRRS